MPNDRLNILHVVGLVASRYAGIAIASQLLAKHQARLGHQVSICTTNLDFPTGVLGVPSGVPVYDDGMYIWYFPSQFRPLLISRCLWSWLRSTIASFDIVHLHGLYRFPMTAAAWQARQKGIPYLVSPHGSLDPYLYRRSRYHVILKRLYERFLEIPSLNRASAISFTTAEEARRTAFLNIKTKPVIIPNGIDWEQYQQLPEKGSFRRRLNIDEQTPLVLFLGRINFKKGFDILIPALGEVAQKHPTVRLAIVGPDNEGYGSKVKAWCKECGISKKVNFVGHIAPNQVRAVYVDADVFVLPSYTENFGLAVVEAMACGTPVVISDQVNIWREVQAAHAGMVVDLNASALAKALCSIIGNRGMRRTFGTAGRRIAEKHYSMLHIAHRSEEVYRQILKENNCRLSAVA